MGFTEAQTTTGGALAGSLAKGFSTIQMGRIAQIEADSQADLLNFNAEVLERNAKARIEKAKFDQVRQALRARKVLGRTIARAAVSGAVLSEGAPFRAISEQAEELELENLLIGHEGMVEAAMTKQQAAFKRIEATGAKGRGKIAKAVGRARAGASLLKDFATFKAAGMFDKSTAVTTREGKATIAKF